MCKYNGGHMEVNFNLRRDKLWLKGHAINDNNLVYIEELLNKFSIYKWKKVININNSSDLLIVYKNKKYKIKVKEDILALELLECNNITPNSKNKEIFNIVKNAGDNGYFYGEDCWYNILNWIRGRKV